MNADAGTRGSRASRVGFLVVLLGGALFVASCFVPYYGFDGPAQRTLSLYEQQTSGAFEDGSLGRLLFLFAGVAIATSIAVVGIARSEPQPSHEPADRCGRLVVADVDRRHAQFRRLEHFA